MSEQNPEQKLQLPKRGTEDYLSAEERAFLHRLLSAVEDFPPKYKSWLIDHEAVNGAQIPASRIVGLP